MALEQCQNACDGDDLWIKMRTVMSRGGCFSSNGGEGSGEGEWIGMAEWIYFLHPPGDKFAATMTDEKTLFWRVYFVRFQRFLEHRVIYMRRSTHGSLHTRHAHSAYST